MEIKALSVRHWTERHFGISLPTSTKVLIKNGTVSRIESGASIEKNIGAIPESLSCITITALEFGKIKLDTGVYIGKTEDINQLQVFLDDLRDNLTEAVEKIHEFVKD